MDRTDKEWQKHIMGLFDASELVEGHPTVSGLRRVVEVALGKIISCVTEIKSSSELSAVAVCTVYVEITKEETGENGEQVTLSNMICQSGAADVSKHNTEEPYLFHPVSTAETRAESRAFRKLLNLSTISAEEATTVKSKVELMTSKEWTGIKNFCKNKSLDLNKVLIALAGVTLDTVERDISCITRDQAIKILESINNKDVVKDFKTT